jgi:hypothetical protein
MTQGPAVALVRAQTITALSMEVVRQGMADNYSCLLDKLVFAREPRDGASLITSRKKVLKLRRLLDDQEANNVLSIIWKESGHVTVEALASLEMSKSIRCGHLTSYRLGILLAEDKEQVAATISRIRNIAISGAAYSLLERQAKEGNKVPIVATAALDDFMLQLGAANRLLCEDALKSLITASTLPGSSKAAV